MAQQETVGTIDESAGRFSRRLSIQRILRRGTSMLYDDGDGFLGRHDPGQRESAAG
jgi:hypothetical protein